MNKQSQNWLGVQYPLKEHWIIFPNFLFGNISFVKLKVIDNFQLQKLIYLKVKFIIHLVKHIKSGKETKCHNSYVTFLSVLGMDGAKFKSGSHFDKSTLI